jgi:hypothetical protein
VSSTLEVTGSYSQVSSGSDYFRQTAYASQWYLNSTGVVAEITSAALSNAARFSLGALGLITWQSTNRQDSGSIDLALTRITAGVLGITATGSTTGAALEMREQTAPSAPSTNNVRIYAEDNGSGKTRLMALFATGAAQQIAIEP